jgi:hypothetical protein
MMPPAAAGTGTKATRGQPAAGGGGKAGGAAAAAAAGMMPMFGAPGGIMPGPWMQMMQMYQVPPGMAGKVSQQDNTPTTVRQPVCFITNNLFIDII